MKTMKVLAIVVLCLTACLAQLSKAVPMGTAFTYQGRLLDANVPAEGIYDFEFKLYDDPNIIDGNQVGWAVYKDDVDVIDGYFTVQLDFLQISIFNGDARWLQVGVRPDDSNDPNAFVPLSPRQELTPTPYALYAQRAGSDNDWIISDGNMYSAVSGNVGIGTTTPEEKLTVVDGTIKCTNIIDGGWAVHGEATGWYGLGIYGHGTSYGGRGVYGRASDDLGIGIFGKATATGEVTNYGGYFLAHGAFGNGVYGEATDTGNVTNYGGYFVARGKYGRAVFGEGTGESARGVWGETSGKYGIGVQGTSSGDNSFGVYGFTSGSSGRGVCGNAFNTGDVENYGGYFEAGGLEGRAVYGEATNTGDVNIPAVNYGGYFLARGAFGQGVYGETTGVMGAGVHGMATGGEAGFGVYGQHKATGNYGYLGSGGMGVYGWSTIGEGIHGASKEGYGVYGYSINGYAGYFDGDVRVTGTMSKGGGSFKIDHPLDPENKYLQHSFVESPDMMNVYNGNVLLDGKGQAVVELPEWFEALNSQFRYQLTCIGGFAPVYIAEKISDNRFKIAGGKKGMEVSWQVTGIRQDAYAKSNRIVVEGDKSAEERGYYLHPAAYGLPEEKGLEAVHNARFPETRQVAKK